MHPKAGTSPIRIQEREGGMIQDPKTHPSSGADALLHHLRRATLAMRGLTAFGPLCEAALENLPQIGCHGLVLRVHPGGRSLSVAASTLDVDLHTLQPYINEPLLAPQGPADPLLRELQEGGSQPLPARTLCQTLLPPQQAAALVDWLGPERADQLVWVAPLRSPTALLGLLMLTQHPSASTAATHVTGSATAALAETLVQGVLSGYALRHLQNALRTLPADLPQRTSLEEAQDNLRGLGTPSESRAPTGQPKVLLVEDDERLRNSTATLLAGLGYHVEGAATGEQAIALYARAREQSQPFAVVLMDQTLAGRIGGVETLRLLQAVDQDIRAILLSGQTSARNYAQMRRFGFRDCLPKPVSLEGLQACIEHVLA